MDQQSRKLDEQIKTAYVPIVDLMGTACKAECVGKNVKFNVTLNPQQRSGIPKDKLSQLLAQHPDIYEDYVETTESRVFKLTKTES